MNRTKQTNSHIRNLALVAACTLAIPTVFANPVSNAQTAGPVTTQSTKEKLSSMCTTTKQFLIAHKKKIAAITATVIGCIAAGGTLAWWLMRSKTPGSKGFFSRSTPMHLDTGDYQAKLKELTNKIVILECTTPEVSLPKKKRNQWYEIRNQDIQNLKYQIIKLKQDYKQ